MKRLMTVLLALSFLTATVAVSYGKDEPSTTKKKKGKKKTTGFNLGGINL